MKSITLNFGTNNHPSMDDVRLEVIKFLELNGIGTPLSGYITTNSNYILFKVSYANSSFCKTLAIFQLIFSELAGNIVYDVGYIEYRNDANFKLCVRNAQNVIDHLKAIGKVQITIG